MAVRRLEEKWRALPPDRELEIRLEVLDGQQLGYNESRERRDAAQPDTKAFRVADAAMNYFTESIAYTENRIAELKASPPPTDDEMQARERKQEDEKRARMRRRVRKNAQIMVERFTVVTPGHNAAFLSMLDVSSIDGADVDAVLRVAGIRLIRLDNPERYAEGGESVDPQKFFALHPDDVQPAIRVLREFFERSPRPAIEKSEQAERATVVWLPRQDNGFQHPDKKRTTYPPNIERLALDHRKKNAPHGWAILRGWGTNLDKGIDPINGCEVEFDEVPGRGRFEAGLDPDEVKEILL